jgi:hypothetical protein
MSSESDERSSDSGEMSSKSDEMSTYSNERTLYLYVRSSGSDGFVQTFSRGVSDSTSFSDADPLTVHKNVTKS